MPAQQYDDSPHDGNRSLFQSYPMTRCRSPAPRVIGSMCLESVSCPVIGLMLDYQAIIDLDCSDSPVIG